MTTEQIRTDFQRAVCDEVDLMSVGLDKYFVVLPFTFEDGDNYVVMLSKRDDVWTLTDEGNTFMRLSVDVPEFDRGNRRAIIERVLASYHVNDDHGELVLSIPGERYGDALFSFTQAITRITDISFLNRERVRTTFEEDFQQVVSESAENRQVEFGYYHPSHDNEHRYRIDARVNGTDNRQVLIFAIPNDDHCNAATITLYRWERWQERFRSLAIFRDQTQINRDVLARFSDVADRQFTTLETAKERLKSFLDVTRI